MDQPPPQYTTTPDVPGPPQILLNLSPLDNNLSFQIGYLGFGNATLQGEVQTKVTGLNPPALRKLEICFRGVESTEGQDPIELCESKSVVWGEGVASTSASVGDGEEQHGVGGGSTPPTSIRFRLDLTPDLPHCIHFGSSALEYSLTATLFPTDPSLPLITRCTPIHLVRTCPPGSLLSGAPIAASSDPPPSTAPQILKIADPVNLSVKLARTVFRRSEPIELVVKIEVPSARAVQEEGLRLRTVSAELIRKVSVISPEEDKSGLPSTIGAKEEEGRGETTATEERGDVIEEIVPPPLPAPLPRTDVLAKSGKSCRFSPTRPIVIRLLLHQPSTISCESITQSTILHNITFEVKVTVGLFAHNTSRHDCVISSLIFLVPDVPSSSIRSDKQREVESNAYETASNWMPRDGPVPTYHESEGSSTREGTSNGNGVGVGSIGFGHVDYTWERAPTGGGAETNGDGEVEEEYDGYEEMSESLSNRLPPPTIDEDVSPPSIIGTATTSSASLVNGTNIDSAIPSPPPNDFQDPSSELYDPHQSNHSTPSHLPHQSHDTNYLLDLDLNPLTISSRSSSLSGSLVLSSDSTSGGSPRVVPLSGSSSYPNPPPDNASLPPPYAGSRSLATAVERAGEGENEEAGVEEEEPMEEGEREEQSGGLEEGGIGGGPPPYTSHQLVELVGVTQAGEVVELR